MQSAFSFLPHNFRSLLEYISPSAFEVVEWKGALQKSKHIAKELLFKKGVKRVSQGLKSKLPTRIVINEQIENLHSPTDDAKSYGESLLEFYFLQLYKSQSIFLDLRSDRFQYGDEGQIAFKPNGLWIEFSPSFLDGMQKLYDGFYLEREDSLQEGLSQLGLTPDDMPENAKKELRDLLESHFSNGKDAPVAFSINKFVESFDSLFKFLKKHRLKISEDFLFLGIYLVTLYLHLDKLGVEYDVNSSFRRARGVS